MRRAGSARRTKSPSCTRARSADHAVTGTKRHRGRIPVIRRDLRPMQTPDSPLRRRLLASGAAGVLGMTTIGRTLAQAKRRGAHVDGYGPLKPERDLATGLPLLELPDGFAYRTFGWAGEALPGDVETPAKHDGMGVVAADGDIVTL